MVEGHGIALVADEPDAVFQSMVTDILFERRGEGAAAGKEEFRFGEAAHHVAGGANKKPLAFADGKIEAADHAEDNFPGGEPEGAAGGVGEGALAGSEDVCVDAGVDDVKFAGIDLASRAVVPFRHGGGGIAVALKENLGDKAGDGDDGVG